MRTFTSKFAWILVALMPFLFGSCDSDPEYDIAYTLEGTWEGRMFYSSTYRGHDYAISHTQICFDRDPYYYSSGTGYWVDYYSNTPWDHVANHINWQVVRYERYDDYGRIVTDYRIEVYLREENYTYFIEDYELRNDLFRGRIYDHDIYGNEIYIDFSMRHTSSPNWSSFDYYYDGFYDDHLGYSNTAGFDGNENMRRSKKVVGAPHRNLTPAAVTAE